MAATVATAVVSTAAMSEAEAQERPADEEVEVQLTLIEQSLAKLELSNCASACEALKSMRRAAERVCSLDGAGPCDKARAKVEEARKKVAAACPDCEAAQARRSVHEEPAPKPATKAPHPEPVREKGDDDDDDEAPDAMKTGAGQSAPVSPSSPPPAEPADGGGCGACVVRPSDSSTHRWWLAAGALALALVDESEGR